MIMAYIVTAIAAGLVAIVVAVVLQQSFWVVLAAYSGVGGAVLLGLPLALAAFGGGRAARTDAPTPVPATLPEAESAPTMRILAVDDDPFILELIPMLAAKAGFPDVITAGSGPEALDLLARDDTRFDCFLFDIKMPGMDGVDLCRQVRANAAYVTTPIVMLTGMRDLKNMGDAYRAGATDYATKPFDIEELGLRLRLAQMARSHGQVADRFNGTQDLRADLPHGVTGLVDLAALTSYLTQLPKASLPELHVYALALDGLAPDQSGAILKQAAIGVAHCLNDETSLMAFTAGGALLIATHNPLPPQPAQIENEAHRWLMDQGYDNMVSVGDPVTPQGPKTERARLAIDGALGRAELRAWQKKGILQARAG